MSECSTISVFGRIRPPHRATSSSDYSLDSSSDDYPNKIHFHLPKSLSETVVNNSKEDYNFSFARIFEPKTHQQEVFDVVAKDVVQRYILFYTVSWMVIMELYLLMVL